MAIWCVFIHCPTATNKIVDHDEADRALSVFKWNKREIGRYISMYTLNHLSLLFRRLWWPLEVDWRPEDSLVSPLGDRMLPFSEPETARSHLQCLLFVSWRQTRHYNHWTRKQKQLFRTDYLELCRGCWGGPTAGLASAGWGDVAAASEGAAAGWRSAELWAATGETTEWISISVFHIKLGLMR